MRLQGWHWVLLLAAVPQLQAQDTLAPIRFGVAWSRGAPMGTLVDVADAAQGFTAQVSLPVARTARIGIRGEFSILTFPERTLQISDESAGNTTNVTVRGTLGFTGAGPRIEMHRGRFAASVAGMAGFVRVITDATARSEADGSRTGAALSLSDYALAGKAVADLHLSVYCGTGATCVGVVGGVDYLTGGAVSFPRINTFRMTAPGELTLDRPAVPPNMFVIRAGVGVEF